MTVTTPGSKALKVLIINQPFVENFCRSQRWAAKTRARVMRHPDGFCVLSGLLKQRGFVSRVIDGPAENLTSADIIIKAKKFRPDFIILDSTTPSIYNDINTAHQLKNSIENTFIIMTGPHATALADETLELANHSIDAVVLGEYDFTIAEIIENFKNTSKTFFYEKLNHINGIVFLNSSGSIVHTPARKLHENLDDLPFPDWSDLNLKNYYDAVKLYPFITINGSRGCPRQCTFCLWPQLMHGRKARYRSVNSIIAEMKHTIDIFPQILKGEFFFEDDTITINKPHALDLARAIKDNFPGITWSANACADIDDPEFFKILADSGLRMLLVGFESGDQNMLKKMKKGTTLNMYRRFSKAVTSAGIKIHGCFVFGLPGETISSIDKTIDLALELPLDTVQFSGAVPFPGTEYYNICKNMNYFKKNITWKDWLDSGEQSAVAELPGIPAKLINDSVDIALKKFYKRPKWLVNFLLNTKDFSDLYRKLRGGANFIKYLIGSGFNKKTHK